MDVDDIILIACRYFTVLLLRWRWRFTGDQEGCEESHSDDGQHPALWKSSAQFGQQERNEEN